MTDATQTRAGIAWEYVIQLANALHRDLWINVPAQATDDYVTQLANLIRTTLAPDLNVFVEYSNEVWNSSFTQYAYNTTQSGTEVVASVKYHWKSDLNYDNLAVDTSQTLGGANNQTWADRRYARRVLQIGNLFASAWKSAGLASPINTRVRVILSGQGAMLSRFDNELKYIATVYGAPSNFIYGIAIAPYANLWQYVDSNNVTGITADQVLAGLTNSVNFYQTSNVLTTFFGQAQAYGLRAEAYEGGFDTFGGLNIAAKQAAMLDPRVQALMTQYLNNWYSKGGDQFNWYTLGSRSFDSSFGTWSITDNQTVYNEPKELAYLQLQSETPPETTSGYGMTS